MDDLLRLINSDDLNDLRAVSQEIEASNRREQVEEKLGPNELFYRSYVGHLGEFGVSYDFDIANGRILVTHMRYGIFDVIPTEIVDAYIKLGKTTPLSLACATMAGLLSPHFKFWNYEADEDEIID